MENTEKIITQTMKPFEKYFKDVVEPVVDQPFIQTVLVWLVVINIFMHVKDIPYTLKQVLNTPASRMFLTFVGTYLMSKNVTQSLMVSVIVTLSFYIMKITKENFQIISPTTDSMAQCTDVKLKDLLDLFDGDKDKLKRVMYASGVPLNLPLNDKNAPLIGTYLVNFGHKVTDKCRSPDN